RRGLTRDRTEEQREKAPGPRRAQRPRAVRPAAARPGGPPPAPRLPPGGGHPPRAPGPPPRPRRRRPARPPPARPARTRPPAAHLRESRVEVLARPSGRTSTALARLAADGSADYDFRLRWAPDESLVEDDSRSVLHFGSIAAFLQPGATVIDRLIDRIASPTVA